MVESGKLLHSARRLGTAGGLKVLVFLGGDAHNFDFATFTVGSTNPDYSI